MIDDQQREFPVTSLCCNLIIKKRKFNNAAPQHIPFSLEKLSGILWETGEVDMDYL